jgi:hypothetical protein
VLVGGGVVATVVVVAGVLLALAPAGQSTGDEDPPQTVTVPLDDLEAFSDNEETSSPPVPTADAIDQAPVLDQEAALAELEGIASEDAPKVLGFVESGGWVPQLSGKCSELSQIDFQDREGRVGFPDGVAETYLPRIGESRVLAYHQAMVQRFGDVALTTLDVLDPDRPDSEACGSSTIWVSLYGASEPVPDAESVWEWCAAQSLPEAECFPRGVVNGDPQIEYPRPD